MSTVTIFDIKRFAIHDGPGIRTTVFLKGCPLRCWWCHNPESQSSEPFTVDIERKVNGKMVPAKKTYGEVVRTEEVMDTILRDLPFYQESGGGVTFSGGEPFMQYDALLELLQLSRGKDLHTTIDTSGYTKKDKLDSVLPFADLFLYDLKNMDPELHKRYTGVDNKLILSNADHLLKRGAKVIFRIPVVPGINTGEDEVDRFITFLKERKTDLEEVHLLPYHRIAVNKYFRLRMKNRMSEIAVPDKNLINKLEALFKTTGLVVKIGG